MLSYYVHYVQLEIKYLSNSETIPQHSEDSSVSESRGADTCGTLSAEYIDTVPQFCSRGTDPCGTLSAQYKNEVLCRRTVSAKSELNGTCMNLVT